MNQTAVNLGAGGVVSYFEDGGASVILDPSLEYKQEALDVLENETLAPDRGYPAEVLSDRSYTSGSVPEGTRPGGSRPSLLIPRQGRPFSQEIADKSLFFGKNLPTTVGSRETAVGEDIFKKAGIESDAAELSQGLDPLVFEQLNEILGRPLEEPRALASRPRRNSRNFLPDH
jgi:hypothetical protein|tara:strand:+ start:1618 stop:2136 length:519 start_codon:yes stop_codon:yes gene_type:complete